MPPWDFCFRSITLYLLYQGNHRELAFLGGQGSIVHLECDLGAAVRWAERNAKRWSFSSGNAGTRCTPFYAELKKLEVLDWRAISASDWRDPIVTDRKQAEFLVQHSFPWKLIGRIGVIDNNIASRVATVLEYARHKSEIVVMRNWYY